MGIFIIYFYMIIICRQTVRYLRGHFYSAEGTWFLYTSTDLLSCSKDSIIKVADGYWRSTHDHRIITRTPTVGRKTTREFYVGQAPFGDRTGWRMQDYHAERMAVEVNNGKSQVFVLLKAI